MAAPGRPSLLLELALEDVATAVDQFVADSALGLPERLVIDAVELLEDLERPPSLEHVAAHYLLGDELGQLGVAGGPQLLDRLLGHEVGPPDEVVEVVETATGPFGPFQRLADQGGRFDGRVVDTVRTGVVAHER